MDTLSQKKLLICALVAIVSILYINIRIAHKRKSLRVFRASDYSFDTGPSHLIRRCKELGQVFITYPSAIKSHIDVADRLFNTEFKDEDMCKLLNIDICLETSPEKCNTMDIKLFMLKYFRELAKDDTFLRRRVKSDDYSQLQRNVIYDIFPDSEAPLNDPKYLKKLKIFGMMIGLAIAHDTFLDMAFEKHLLAASGDANCLLNTLEDIDPQQYKWYQKIFDSSTDSLKFVPDSTKPFRDADDPDPLAIKYYRTNFPQQKAAEQIFIDPFSVSREYIFEGMDRLLSRHYYNSSNYRAYSVDFKQCFSYYSLSDEVNVHLWKDNSAYDGNGKIFWRLLARFKHDDKLRIFQKVTGFIFIPVGGIRRMPKTKIILGSSKEMFPEPFCIIIDPNYDEKMLENEMLRQSK